MVFRNTLGLLQYLLHTRLDITFAVNKLSKINQAPTTLHWQALKCVLCYLQGISHYGVHIQPAPYLSITTFSNIDWATSLDDQLSIGSYCVFLGPSLVSWSSKKQAMIACSSIESEEYCALSHTTQKILWLRSLLREPHCYSLKTLMRTMCPLNILKSMLTLYVIMFWSTLFTFVISRLKIKLQTA